MSQLSRDLDTLSPKLDPQGTELDQTSLEMDPGGGKGGPLVEELEKRTHRRTYQISNWTHWVVKRVHCLKSWSRGPMGTGSAESRTGPTGWNPPWGQGLFGLVRLPGSALN